jgi:hypothetical protein
MYKSRCLKKLNLNNISVDGLKVIISKNLKDDYFVLKEAFKQRNISLDEKYKIKSEIEKIQFLFKHLKFLNKKRKLLKLYAKSDISKYFVYKNELFKDVSKKGFYSPVHFFNKNFILNKNNLLETHNFEINNPKMYDDFWKKYPDGIIIAI